MALEAKYRLDGESRMQALHDQLANLQVTEAEQYDPARVIQELRCICVELGALGDTVVPARKTHAFFRALPDSQYESLKKVLLCDRQRGGTASTFEDLAARATSYHAMQIRGKVTAKEQSAGRDGHDAVSRERALNTAACERSRNPSRRNNGRDGRKYRGKGTSNTNIAPREVTTITVVTRQGTRTATCLRIAMQVDRKVHANVGTATVQAEEDDGVIAISEKTATEDAITAGTLLSTAGMTAPFATRTRKVTTRTVLMLHRSAPNGNVFLTHGARSPRTPTWRILRLVLVTVTNVPGVMNYMNM